MTDQTRPLCAYCGHNTATDQHHLMKRSTHPELINDPKNLVGLCGICHHRTKTDAAFLKALQEIFYFWKKNNLDIYTRAQASIDALLDGREVEFLTPAMTDHYLQLAGAKYSYLSEQLAAVEKLEAVFYHERIKNAEELGQKMPLGRLKMEWRVTENGQNMIDWKAKLKSLEKMQSNLRSRLQRFRTEYSSQR